MVVVNIIVTVMMVSQMNEAMNMMGEISVIFQ